MEDFFRASYIGFVLTGLALIASALTWSSYGQAFWSFAFALFAVSYILYVARH